MLDLFLRQQPSFLKGPPAYIDSITLDLFSLKQRITSQIFSRHHPPAPSRTLRHGDGLADGRDKEEEVEADADISDGR